MPPGAENPPREPVAQITRWQGIISGRGFFANTTPTALAALGLAVISANRP